MAHSSHPFSSHPPLSPIMLSRLQQAVYSILLAKADDVLDYDDEEGNTFMACISMSDFEQYLISTNKREAYIEAYINNLEPFLRKTLETPPPLDQRIMGIINYGLIWHGGFPDHKLPDTILTHVGEKYWDSLVESCEKVTTEIRIDGQGLVKLIITGPVSFVVSLDEFDSDTVETDPNMVYDSIKRFVALSSLPVESQLAVYKALVRSDLSTAIGSSVNETLIPSSVFNSSDVYLETAMKAAISVMDDAKLLEFIGRMSAEFSIFPGPFASGLGTDVGMDDNAAPVA